MKKRLTSFLLVLALSFSFSLPAFAVDDMDYYSFPPVGGSEPSTVSLFPLNPSATGDGWSSSDSSRLRDIWQALTDSSSGNPGSIAYCVWWIWNYLKDDIRSSLGNIDRNTSVTASRILDANSLLGSINTAVTGIDGYATENTLSSFYTYFSDSKFVDSPWSTLDGLNGLLGKVFDMRRHANYTNYDDFPYQFPFYDPTTKTFGYYNYSFSDVLGHLIGSLLVDQQFYATGTGWTLYHYVKNLSETLASEDDKQLAENYKENREQAETDFLSGKSGKTSLGKGDFSNASQVGGALNDTFNMGGAAKVSDFLSGFGSAGSESQAWFSQTTANNLNAVEAGDGTQGVSTFSDDGETMVDVDPDPYNMSNIFDRYDWLEGVNMDD